MTSVILGNFLWKNLVYIFYNYLIIVKVYIFSNSQKFCYRKIFKNERITATPLEVIFFCGEHDFSELDHLNSKSEEDSVSR